MPGDFGGPVCSCAQLSIHAHETAGAPCTRHPRAPFALEGRAINGKPRAVPAARSRAYVFESHTLVMPGLDPGIHPLHKKFFRRRWIAGSSPAMTNYIDVIARSFCDEAIHSCFRVGDA